MSETQNETHKQQDHSNVIDCETNWFIVHIRIYIIEQHSVFTVHCPRSTLR